MRLERVHLADVPCAGPNENYRAARGHCGEYTRVLTATLCTIADGFDRLVPIVASATVSPRLAESNRSYDDDVARLEEYHDDEFDEFDEFGAGPSPTRTPANPSTRRTDTSATACTRRGTPTSCARAGKGPNALETLRDPLRWTPSSRRWEKRG